MEIRDSTRRHGISDSDIRHVIDSAVAVGPVETNVDNIDGVLYIGPDRTGGMLEVPRSMTSMMARSPSIR